MGFGLMYILSAFLTACLITGFLTFVGYIAFMLDKHAQRRKADWEQLQKDFEGKDSL